MQRHLLCLGWNRHSIQLANSCTATGIGAITGEIANLFSRIGGLGAVGTIASAVSGLASGGSIGGVVSGLIGSVAGGSGGIGSAIGGLLGGGNIANTVGNAIGNLAGGSTFGNVITTAIGDLGGGTGIGDLLGGGNAANAVGNAISGLAGGSSVGNIVTNAVGDLVGGSSGISGAIGNLLGGSSAAQEVGGVVEQGISGAIGNLSTGILGGEVGKTIDAVTAMVNPFVGSMFNFLFSKLEPILNKGLDALYKFIVSQVLAATGNAAIAHAAGVAAQVALTIPVKALEKQIACAANKVVRKLPKSSQDIVKELRKNVKKIRTCAGTQFAGSLLNSVVTDISDELVSELNGVSKILAGSFDVEDFLRGKVPAIKPIGGFFDCNQDEGKCNDVVEQWTVGKGHKAPKSSKVLSRKVAKDMDTAYKEGNPNRKSSAVSGNVFNSNLNPGGPDYQKGFVGTATLFSPFGIGKDEDSLLLIGIFVDGDLKKDKKFEKNGFLVSPGNSEVLLIKDVESSFTGLTAASSVKVVRKYQGKASEYAQSTSFSYYKPSDKLNGEFSITSGKREKSKKDKTFDEKYGKWDIYDERTRKKKNKKKSPLGDCFSGEEDDCKPPIVNIFGGLGSGATAEVIMGNYVKNGNGQRTGSIIGVKVTNGGSGYRYPPFVEFEDDCDQGYGAVARSIIKDGRVIAIYLVKIGESYPVGQTDTYAVTDVAITDGGSDYTNDDSIIDNSGNEYSFEIDDNGTIIDVKPINIIETTDFPVITIESETGSGALLTPILGEITEELKASNTITMKDTTGIQKDGTKIVVDCIT